MKTFTIATLALMASPFVSAATVFPDVTPRSYGSANVDDIEKRADCSIEAIWYNNWPSGGFRRYGVKLRATPQSRRKDLLDIFCSKMAGPDDATFQNRACYSNNDSDGSYNADVTTFEGDNGHHQYLNFFQDKLNSWRATTNCDVNSSL